MCFFVTIVCGTMVLLLVLLSISLANGFDYHKRCLLFNKTCVPFCPKFMHAYHTRCDRDTTSQRTCEIPTVYPLGYTCGWSRCDCNGDLYLDEAIQLCVPLDMCPNVVHRTPSHRRAAKAKNRAKKQKSKIIVPDDVDLIDVINE